MPKDDTLVIAVRETLKQLSQGVIAMLGAPPEGTEEFYHEIPMRDGFSSSLKVHKPTKGGGPLFVFAFGGGFLG
jgi:hypothetical protein